MTLTRIVNLTLIVLALTAPLVINYGLSKQDAIETTRRGQ